MPQIFKSGKYCVYLWANENDPLEPIHVHVAEGHPRANATKIWITQTGRSLLCNNSSKVPSHDLRKLMKIIEANSNLIIQNRYSYFGEITYYC